VSGDDQRIQDLAEILQRHGDGGHEALDDYVVHKVHVGLHHLDTKNIKKKQLRVIVLLDVAGA